MQRAHCVVALVALQLCRQAHELSRFVWQIAVLGGRELAAFCTYCTTGPFLTNITLLPRGCLMWGCTYSTAAGDAAALRLAGNGLNCAGVMGEVSHTLLTCTSRTGRSGSHSPRRPCAVYKVCLDVARSGLHSKSGFTNPCLAADFFISNTAPFHAMRVGVHLYAKGSARLLQCRLQALLPASGPRLACVFLSQQCCWATPRQTFLILACRICAMDRSAVFCSWMA